MQRLDGSYPNKKYYFDFRSYTFICPYKQIYSCMYLYIKIDSLDKNLKNGFMIYLTTIKRNNFLLFLFLIVWPFFLTSFFFFILNHIQCVWYLMRGQVRVHSCLPTQWSFFDWLQIFFLVHSFPHPLALGLSHCIYGQPLDPMGIHLICCTHGGERTASHDIVWDAFAFITKDVRFHVLCE